MWLSAVRTVPRSPPTGQSNPTNIGHQIGSEQTPKIPAFRLKLFFFVSYTMASLWRSREVFNRPSVAELFYKHLRNEHALLLLNSKNYLYWTKVSTSQCFRTQGKGAGGYTGLGLYFFNMSISF